MVCYIRFVDGNLPEIFVIPSTVWNNCNNDNVFVNKDYNKPGQKSKPEWGINISNKNLNELKKYSAANYFS